MVISSKKQDFVINEKDAGNSDVSAEKPRVRRKLPEKKSGRTPLIINSERKNSLEIRRNELPTLKAAAIANKKSEGVLCVNARSNKEKSGKVSDRVSFSELKNKDDREEINEALADYEGKKPDLNSAEYSGMKKNSISLVKRIILEVVVYLKCVATAFLNPVVIIVMLVAGIATAVLAGINNATYSFIADEEKDIRKNMALITMELSEEINTQKAESKADNIIVSGQLVEWKKVIAFWWTLKQSQSEEEQWDGFFSGEDKDTLSYIFYQFNKITYEVEEKNKKVTLRVNIENSTVEEMNKHWELSRGQKNYYKKLLKEKKIWQDILGTNEIASIAFSQIGNPSENYTMDGVGNKNLSFVLFCLEQTGSLTDGLISICKTADDLLLQMENEGFIIDRILAKEGDIAFLEIDGKTMTGIVTNLEKNTVSITICDYPKKKIVDEYNFARTSEIIKKYARVYGFSVAALNGAEKEITVMGKGKFAWPVGAKIYYVTSPYGPRNLLGTVFHHGVDIAVPEDTPIVAAKAGTVVNASYSNAVGYYIEIDHGKGIKSVYMHNNSFKVAKGDKVKKGQLIALSGNTGTLSTGPHCHFAIMLNGQYVDPAPYLGIPSGMTGDMKSYLK